MSSVGRATSRGSKSGKVEHTNATAKAQKTDTKTETAKTMENSKAQEQMRIAQIIGDKEDPQLKEKIKQVMDATHRPEIEVVSALFDSDYDANRAVNMLIEGQNSGEWETSSKKKKNRQPSANSKSDSGAPRGISSADVDGENWDDETPTKPVTQADTQRTRNQRGGGSGAPRMRGRGAQDNRGWRGRENKENERNLEESRGSGPSAGSAGGDRDQRDSFRRGGAGGSNRGGRLSNGAGRGGGRGGSRGGPRSFSSRGGHDRGGAAFPRATPWNPEEDGTDAKSNNFPSPEDWDNEEYTGSLSDTKVFTPSNVGGDSSGNDGMASHTVGSSTDPSSQPGVNSTNLNYAQSAAGGGSLSAAQTQYLRQLPDNKLQSSNALSGTMAGPMTNSTESKTATRGMTPSAPSSGITYNSYAASAASSGASAPAASSYPSSYSAVSASVPSVSSAAETNFTPASSVNTFSTYQTGQAQPASYTATATSYSTVYGSHQDGTTRVSGGQALPARTKTQRPRVPPPSKIPQSAVEMPGDGVSNIGALDVQFGALDFGTEAFEMEPQSSPKSAPSVQPQSQPSPMANKYPSGVSAGGMDSVSAPASQASLDMDPFASAKAAALTQNLKDTLLQGSQSQQTQSVSQSQSNDLKSQPSNFNQQSRGPGVGVVQSPLDSLVKNDQGSVAVSASAAGAAGSLPYSAPNSNYQSSYTSQKSVASGYQPSTGYNQTSYSASQAVSANAPNTYPTNYPSNATNQGYQNVGVQSVYGGGNAGAATGGNTSGSVVGSTSGYTTASSASVYQNSYGTTTASASSTNKLTSVLSGAKDMPQYDTTATSSSNLSGPMTSSSGAPGLSGPHGGGSVNNSQSLGMQGATSLPNANNTSTKVTNSSAKNVVQNVPPGVAPIIAAGTQYMISQGGLQYFAQQPAVYGYEEQQILPLRIPHMPAGYYDISFQQAPTSLATGRDGSLANVPYSMSDARFARTDNASPVPSSLSQQNPTQAQHQPMMNAASFPPGYTYYYGGSVLPANYQYGTPTAMYPQVAPATNAHGNSNSSQYPKPGSYGSSYGSGYESLSASQDYSKGSGGYTGGHSGAQTGSKAGVGANAPSTGSSSTDIFNKTHVALSKVNSYDKGFHSGTPPPFNLAGNQNTGMAPSGAFPTPLYIPPPMPQHHSTTLMQHPVHQQMDMRNTSRRSESGNNSGQRSQSSTQSNKPGSKQVYSQNYWAN
ncbi:protein lingerer isoform X1 [Thrips palmi]|uniref:Protein lingerer isoform X1 n=1 Tax=Thrips palmi TaxID=161013 RepID=A0A6P8YZI3_THRPL|nr:protein lingerer isoform X1 [Thrips palmi]XP_034245579.1 protein lingerer isoform X1 [Thrips palmi]XP_034245580.1 protein lingerer isoform X1 [Thrips palmi]XP_034245581.1 protein lingerer isoform X1 [Thrips palmi]XP_034245582.1 protein lingerer isoform X1 [Thrips palmi]XP_034245583.1 protein lingerer isoform X1 [Thrips palmi]